MPQIVKFKPLMNMSILAGFLIFYVSKLSIFGFWSCSYMLTWGLLFIIIKPIISLYIIMMGT